MRFQRLVVLRPGKETRTTLLGLIYMNLFLAEQFEDAKVMENILQACILACILDMTIC